MIEPPPPAEGEPIRFRPLPEVVPPPKPADDAPPTWKAEANAIREGTAASFFDLAKRAGQTGVEQFALAGECLRGVLDRDPYHREARRLLGYVAYDGGWAKPHAAQLLEKGMVLDPTFGWVAADWVPHLKNGELPGAVVGGRVQEWLPAAQADALRADFEHGWKITTEHFAIQTDVPLSEAIAFGRRLEALRDAFFFLFADVIGPDLPLAKRFRNSSLQANATTETRHRVAYYASRDEYISALRPTEGARVTESLGFYREPRVVRSRIVPGQCFFFRDLDGAIDVTSTLFHETSHQLLFESAGPTRYEQNVGNYWVWEGLGTYFETFDPQPDGSYRIGGLVGPRVAKARDDILVNDRFVPIAELVALEPP